MLARFCAYGFLKNQRYFEPFLLLALLDHGLSFADIGLLVAAREVCINVLEIPSGSLADVHGRRRVMVLSFVAYLVAFGTFTVGTTFLHFLAAMLLMGVGDAFRSGTHKAMILHWLKGQGRADEKVAVYGRTRSWSKLGSAVSVPIGTLLVLTTSDYRSVFLLSALPAAANLVNLATYPRSLDAGRGGRLSLGRTARHLTDTFRALWRRRRFRGLLAEAMSFQGLFKTTKDYLQPLLQGAALGMPFLLGLEDAARTAILIGVVYVTLHLLSAAASRRAHTFAEGFRGDDAAARRVWWLLLLTFVGLLGGLAARSLWIAALGFVAFAVLQNLFRPLMVSRLSDASDEEHRATALSLESQASALVTTVLAPVLGALVDRAAAVASNSHDVGAQLLPVAAAGLALTAAALIAGAGKQRAEERAGQS